MAKVDADAATFRLLPRIRIARTFHNMDSEIVYL